VKLYSGPLSLFSAKVRIALAEKQLDYALESVPWSPATGYEPKHPEVIAHNPKAQVPVLVAGTLVLYDSSVILEYLEDLKPEPALYPREIELRARCRLLELEADELFFPHVWTLIRERFYAQARAASGDRQQIVDAEARIQAHYGRLAGQLGAAEFLCGAFSVADIAHALVSSFATGLGARVPEHLGNVRAWLARVLSRPSVARELSSMASVHDAGRAQQPAMASAVGHADAG
jgi:glutathione S-transferase